MKEEKGISFIKKIPLRWKFTLLYSGILFALIMIFSISMNLAIKNHFERTALLQPIRKNSYSIQIREQIQEQMKENRAQDLEQIQEFTLISILPTVFVSLMFGYYISGQFLLPLNKLSRKIGELTQNNLGQTIPIETNDEVALITNSFNQMSIRLKKQFDLQEEFIQNASHDIRTPISIIHANLSSVSLVKNAKQSDYKEAIDKSLKSIERLNTLTDSILNLYEAKKLLKTDVNLNDLVNDQILLLKDYAKEKGVKIIKKFEDNRNVRIDKLKIGRAIYNIIHNAIKFSSSSKKASVIITIKRDRISIKDNGIGIPKDKTCKIFDRFYRVDKARSGKIAGNGLGLAIAKDIIEAHNGKIECISNVGEGSEFVIFI